MIVRHCGEDLNWLLMRYGDVWFERGDAAMSGFVRCFIQVSLPVSWLLVDVVILKWFDIKPEKGSSSFDLQTRPNLTRNFEITLKLYEYIMVFVT